MAHGAPGREEVEHHGFVFDILERYAVSIEIGEAHPGRRLAPPDQVSRLPRGQGQEQHGHPPQLEPPFQDLSSARFRR